MNSKAHTSVRTPGHRRWLAATVVAEDSAASEMNQRGLKSSAFRAGRLMPQALDVYRFQQWVRTQLA